MIKLTQNIEINGTTVGSVQDNQVQLNGLFSKDDLLGIASLLSDTLVVGQKYQGGIYIGTYQGKKIIIAEQDAPKDLNFTDAKEYCSTLELNGYTDWYLPSKKELNFAYKNARDLMQGDWYWSSTEYSAAWAWYQIFHGSFAGHQSFNDMTLTNSVRAFRSVI